MRKVIATLFASVDGYASDAPDEEMRWVTDEFGDEMAAFGLEEMDKLNTLVLGRVTYEIMAPHWPEAGDEEGGFAERMNSIDKVVFSKTLGEGDIAWSNTRLARGGVVEEIASLKQQAGGDIGLSGSVDLVRSLIRLGLVDLLRLQVHPVVLGPAGGKPIFDGYPTTDLDLVRSRVLDSRVVVLDYEPHSNGKERR